jgi:multidrug efflux pump
LRHQKESEKSWFYRASENTLEWIIEKYATILRFVLKHQPATLVLTVGTLALTIFLFLRIPKGFFPVQDTGVLLGISEAPATISFQSMAERQQSLTRVILKDPDVVSLSSFIGVDGVNMLPNSGRIQINLKSREERKDDAEAVIRRLQASLNDVKGITLYLQPVQDLTVEDRISRTQFQYTMEDANAQELNEWVPKLIDRLRNLPQLTDVATDQQERGTQATLVIDRDTASRLGILPQAIDDTLYDAFGQRQVSTISSRIRTRSSKFTFTRRMERRCRSAHSRNILPSLLPSPSITRDNFPS